MTTTTERHPCTGTTRAGAPCRALTTADRCPAHDPDRTCGADNGHGGHCRRTVAPGRLCDSHDPDAIERRREDERLQHQARARDRAAHRAAGRAHEVEADAVLAALDGCTDCTAATLRAVLLVDFDVDDDLDAAPAPSPMSVAWPVVVEHLRAGHGLRVHA